MSEPIAYFFTAISPFTYLGHRTLLEIAGRHGRRIDYRPVNLAGVWEVSGGVPLPQRSQTRQKYRLIELQRIALLRGEEIITQPGNFPTDPTLADHSIIAIQHGGDDPGEFTYRVMHALWAEDRTVSDQAFISELLTEAGHDANHILDLAGSPEIAEIRAQNTQAAIENNCIGSPCYVLDGEPFWGQDHLELLEHMIASGRVAIKPE